MVKLVGVLGGGEDGESSSPRECLARRQLPLSIEPDLTMVMALDDSCMACGVDPCGRGCGVEPCGRGHGKNSGHDWGNFLRNYRSLGKDEATASLMVTPGEVVTTLGQLVTCVGCRRSVETLYQALTVSGDSALEPLVIAKDGVVSVNRDHLEVEDSLANLFCCQLRRLSKELVDGGDGKGRTGKKGGRGGRCAQHSLGVKKLVTMSNWLDTWDCMEKECREEVVLLPYPVLRQTLDGYLKKHSFCSECTNMVNRAYTLLVEEGQEPAKAAGEKPADSDPGLNSDGTVNLYTGISACTADLHVHVKCDQDFIGQLFTLAEPELSGLRQERHAKTIEIAQKEVLTCIGLALFERFQRIQQKLREGEQTCDLLFLTVIKTLRRSLDMAAEKKRGVGDLELLCQEIDREEKRKEGKRERKRNRRARRKENKNVAVLANISGLEEDEEDGVSDGDSGVSSGDSHRGECGKECDKENVCISPVVREKEKKKKRDRICDKKVPVDSKPKLVVPVQSQVKPGCPGKVDPVTCSKKTSVTSPLKRVLYQPRVGTWDTGISLEDMLEEDEDKGEGEEIPQEDIRMFLDMREDMVIRRQQLRENLKKRFAQLCVNGLTPVN